MVDQAVLSLAKEQPLDPLANFIVARDTKMAARDTRNMAFGVIPLEEIPGGDGAALEEWGAENNISVRKNFTPVPIYLPSVKIGADGRRQNQGEAARYADRVQAARQGGERCRPLRLRGRRNADPSGTGRAAGVAALRAARRCARSRARRARRRRAGRRRLRVDIGASVSTLQGAASRRSNGRKTSPCASTCAPAFPSKKPARKASSSASRSNATPITPETRSKSTCRSSPIASRCADTRSSRSRAGETQDASRRQRRSASRKFLAQDRRSPAIPPS